MRPSLSTPNSSRRSHWFAIASIVLFSASVAACGDDSPGGVDTEQDASPGDTSRTDADGDATDSDATDEANVKRQLVLGVPESARMTLDGLDGEVHVVRTAHEIPHIHATTLHDLYMAEGFTVARDRYIMLELLRRVVQGNLAELLGDLGLERDVESRMSGMTFIAESLLAHQDAAGLERLNAFAAGVNQYIAAVSAGTLPAPPELDVLAPLLGASANPGSLLKPFDALDVISSLVFAVYVASFETGDVNRGYQVAQLDDPNLMKGQPFEDARRAGVIEDIWGRYAPIHGGGSAPGWGREVGSNAVDSKLPGLTLPATWSPSESATTGARSGAAQSPSDAERRGESPASKHVQAPRVPKANLAMLKRASERMVRQSKLLNRPYDTDYGSNEWAVAGFAGKDGVSLLASDGHLSLDVPSYFYQIGLDLSVFGDEDFRQKGLVIPGILQLAVGTNGKVAWTQTQESGDITDWYIEEIQLDAAGAPKATRFEGDWKDLIAIDETYVVADVPAMGSTGRSETWTRWQLFDGRWLAEVEGRPYVEGDTLADGESVVNMAGTLMVPSDTDNDGAITAISYDYTGFDIGNMLAANHRWGTSEDVWDFLDGMRYVTTYSQNMAAADKDGNVLYTGYQSTPCRKYLERDSDGNWAAGSDPRLLLDGSRYHGFTIPLDDEGRVDEGPGADDPYKCVVPFDKYPASITPDRGYVANANNDPGSASLNDSITDDPWYIGGPWTNGYRSTTIERELEEAISSGTASVARMAEIQANVDSRMAEDFLPALLGAVATAKAHAADGATTGTAGRMAAIYAADSDRIDTVVERLEGWQDAGLQARSGVETFYNSPTSQDVVDSVATTVFNAWFSRVKNRIFNDERFPSVWQGGGTHGSLRVVTMMLRSRGAAGNIDNLASYDDALGESVFFDVLQTPEVESSDELIMGSLASALAWLEDDAYKSADMDTWLWGLRHHVRFESLLVNEIGSSPLFATVFKDFQINTSVLPLAENMAADDPRKGLKWFPRSGDNFGVDAANPGFDDDWTYGQGPVMRMIIGFIGDRVVGQNVVPGGQSGYPQSSVFADQAALWLGNDYVPLNYHVDEMVEAAISREVLAPAAP